MKKPKNKTDKKPTKNRQKTDKNRQKPFLFRWSSEKPTKPDTDFGVSVAILGYIKICEP